MTKLNRDLYHYFVQDAKLGERWLLVLGVLFAVAFRQQPELNEEIFNTDTANKASLVPEVSTQHDSLLLVAEALIGVPYQYAGKTPDGFDCSGFTRYVYGQVDVSLEASSYRQFQEGQALRAEEALPGDLVFFRSRNKISHVGIITKRTGQATYFIHASSSRGVVEDQLETDYFRTRLAGIRRVIE